MSINWYPGHMVRAKREIEENLKLVDMVVIILDARAPFSCRNPELERMVNKKPLIMVLNKKDLADPDMTSKYIKSFKEQGINALAMDSVHTRGKKQVLQALSEAYKPFVLEMLARGRRVRPARVMVAGVPNTGKSSFLNCIVGQKAAVTGARPGVTRGKQWIRIQEDIEFLDTPGVMWPRIETPEQGLKLALLDIVGARSYDEEEVALFLVQFLQENNNKILEEKFHIQVDVEDSRQAFNLIGRKKGYLLRGGDVDPEKTARFLLQEFRKGRLGSISLDHHDLQAANNS